MPCINKIPLHKIKVITNLQNAEVGALLQIAPGNSNPAAEIFLRCALGEINGVVHLEGGSAGVFLTDAELNSNPAIDISDLAHIVLDDPAPRNISVTNRIKAGDICQTSNSVGNTFLCMAVCLPPPLPTVKGFAVLYPEHRGKISTVLNHQFYIGRAAVVPLAEAQHRCVPGFPPAHSE